MASLPFLALDRKNKKENQYESDQMQTAKPINDNQKDYYFACLSTSAKDGEHNLNPSPLDVILAYEQNARATRKRQTNN